ncbi:MAG: universal stress protein [Planctomycetales bacterium]|nr:universal stress protein [Planctomycetales bacterium]
MFSFAYDGSINGDWVSHYAVQLASAHVTRRLNVLHVRSPQTIDAELQEKLQRLQVECQRVGVELVSQILSPTGSVSNTLLSAVGRGPEQYLLCGIRVRPGSRGLLSGTIAEQVLRARHCNALAIRVVQPGLLGQPRHFLLPVAGHHRNFGSGMLCLRLFAPQISRLHIMHVIRLRRWQLVGLSHETAERMRVSGYEFCKCIEKEISEHLGIGSRIVDTHVVVSDDIPREIMITANKTKSRLICMASTERTLPSQLFTGNVIEQVLRDTVCDVVIYRGME